MHRDGAMQAVVMRRGAIAGEDIDPKKMSITKVEDVITGEAH